MKTNMGEKKINIKIRFGNSYLTADIPSGNYVTLANSNQKQQSKIPEGKIISNALEHPLYSPQLRDIINENNKIAILTSDISRPFPTNRVLPYILNELRNGNVQNKNIKIIFALGAHRKHSKAEHKKLLKGIDLNDIEILDSDADEYVNLGRTDRGTPVDIFKPVMDSDKIVCLGNIEHHYFAGFTGGYKALMPGVSSKRAISNNHSLLADENSKAGIYDNNPVRSDINEFSKFIKADFILNVILDKDKRIVDAVAGDGIKAHRIGCHRYDELFGSTDSDAVDIIITGEGAPKDANLYQAQKYLETAASYVNKNGAIIWCAKAGEGFGNRCFEEWMLNKSVDQIISDIESNFVLGGHKAAFIAKILKKATVFVISELKDETVLRMGMIPAKSLQHAIDSALALKGQGATISQLSNSVEYANS